MALAIEWQSVILQAAAMSEPPHTPERTRVCTHTHKLEGAGRSLARSSEEDKITLLQKKVSHVTVWVTPGKHDTLGKAWLKSNHSIFS